jgi:hypothetical protein
VKLKPELGISGGHAIEKRLAKANPVKVFELTALKYSGFPAATGFGRAVDFARFLEEPVFDLEGDFAGYVLEDGRAFPCGFFVHVFDAPNRAGNVRVKGGASRFVR